MSAPVRSRIAATTPLEIRPDGVAPLRRAGRDPYRVLLFGGGAMVGWGLLDHDRGLPGQIADRLAHIAGHGVDLDVVVDVDPTKPDALALLQGLRIARYDAVIVVLGEHAALDGTARRVWADEYRRLAGTLHAQAAKAAAVFVFDSARAMVAVSSTGLRRRRALASAARLADVAREISTGGRVGFAELTAPTVVLDWGRQFTSSNLRDWAGSIAKTVAPALAAGRRELGPEHPVALRHQPQDERFRQRAVDALRLRGLQRDGFLDGVARQAKAHYRATHAFVSIVDGDRVWERASTRSLLGEIPRALAFCDQTVRSDAVHVVGDTSLDPRFDGVPVLGGSPIGFYAGEPIHSVDGYRIGALCVVDAVARTAGPDRFADLHVLAGQVEKEIWASALGGRRI